MRNGSIGSGLVGAAEYVRDDQLGGNPRVALTGDRDNWLLRGAGVSFPGGLQQHIQLESTFWEHSRIHSIQTLYIVILNAHHVLQTLHDEADRVARPLNGLDSQLVVSRTQVHSVNLDVKCEGVENEFLYHACMHV